MPSPKTYATAGAFRRALEERLKKASLTESDRPQPPPPTGVIRPSACKAVPGRIAPRVLKGGYALELRFKAARSTVDIDLTVQRIAASAGGDQNQIVREMLQSAADISLGDWFEFAVGPASMDLTAAPYGGARYPVEARMDERTFARFHLDAGVGDVVMHRWKQSCAGTGWDSPASNRRVS
jgi:Nucleotidyl transferase AbiEii toxin, Type IV TA system